MSENQIVGYTTGVFDLFHVGHLKILENAKSHCDYLIVGVTTDEITIKMKGRPPVIPFEERIQIVESITFVDKAIAKTSTDNLLAFEKHPFHVFFKGNDWQDTPKGLALEKSFAPLGVKVQYFPYTTHTSSTILRSIIEKLKFKLTQDEPSGQ